MKDLILMNFKSNLSLHFITPKPDTSLRRPSPSHCSQAGPPREGAGETMTSGYMELRGPVRGPTRAHGPIQSTLRSERPTGKTVKNSVKTFLFFLRSHHFSDQTSAFSSSILDFTKPEFRQIWADPGPMFNSRCPCSQVTQLFWKKSRSGGKSLATPRSIWLDRDLNLKSFASEGNSNALPICYGWENKTLSFWKLG